MDIYKLSESIRSKKDFENFLKLLIQDFNTNRNDWKMIHYLYF